MKHTLRFLCAVLFFTLIPAGSQSFAASKGIVTITDKGTHFEVQQDYTQSTSRFEMGEHLYEQILLSIPEYENLIDSYLAELFPSPEIYTFMLSRVDDIKPQIPVQYRDEIDGMCSKASGTQTVAGDGKLSADEIYLMQLLPDVARTTECSGISVFGSRSASGSLMTARILDWYEGSKNQLAQIQSVTTVKYGTKSLCMIGYLGFVGVLTAFNSDGVFAGILDSPSESPYSSTNKRSYINDIRLALENYGTVADVASFLSDTLRKYTFNHLVLLSDKNSAGVLENNFSGTGLNIHRALRTDTSTLNPGITWGFNNAVATVNSFLLSGNLDNHTSFSFNTDRWESFKNELQRCGDDVTMDELKQIVSYVNADGPQTPSDSDLYNLSTQHIVLFQPSDFHVEVSFRPKQGDLPQTPVFETIPVNFMANKVFRTRLAQSKSMLRNGSLMVSLDGSNSIMFKLSQPSMITIQLFDALGREVRSDFLGQLSAGVHNRKYSTGELAGGMYYYSVKEQGSNTFK
ncbi:MAG: hypothetical protein GX639_06005 [Fibrobacter sp.]|nr:hypothetical protein [Fibrobacter sp.]